MTSEIPDYRAMLEELQAHPGESRAVWSSPLSGASRRKASNIASTLKGWIRLPHRGPNGRVECHHAGCDPVHNGEGDAVSRSDPETGEVFVFGIWEGPTSDQPRPLCAEDVLFVLNDLQPVDLSGWTFCVLTDAPNGNFSPFERGEILVLDEHRTEVGGGRRPAKSDVAEQNFATLAEALACREQVLAGTWPRSYGGGLDG